MDFGLALLPSGVLVGIEYYPYDNDTNFSELNIYLFIIALHFRFYNYEW